MPISISIALLENLNNLEQANESHPHSYLLVQGEKYYYFWCLYLPASIMSCILNIRGSFTCLSLPLLNFHLQLPFTKIFNLLHPLPNFHLQVVHRKLTLNESGGGVHQAKSMDNGINSIQEEGKKGVAKERVEDRRASTGEMNVPAVITSVSPPLPEIRDTGKSDLATDFY